MKAIQCSKIDFGIAYGHRSVEEQQRLYAKGRTEAGDIVTYIDGVTKKSKHNYSPSKAVDIYPFYGGKAQWNDLNAYHYLAGLIIGIATERGIDITWGGFWKSFTDRPHFEIP